jgi:DNA-binding PadR family transcriptional regulator
MVTTAASLLEYALLGLILQGPASGYDLRKLFASTPMGTFSDSPGAIYPALRRLARRGWIAAGAAARGGRRRRLFSATAAGRRALGDWIGLDPTRDDVVRNWDALMLRLAFMTGNAPPARVTAFLAALELELLRYVAELEAFLAASGGALTGSGRLAFESGLAGYKAQALWLRRALAPSRKTRRAS